MSDDVQGSASTRGQDRFSADFCCSFSSVVESAAVAQRFSLKNHVLFLFKDVQRGCFSFERKYSEIMNGASHQS
jgi:hypothetical protein